MAKVPRASLAVSIHRDPDWIMLMKERNGRPAFADFVNLIILAKNLGNGGTFVEPFDVVAQLIFVKPSDLHKSIDLIARVCESCGYKPWMTVEDDRVSIRTFRKWNQANGWGGSRSSSGRKKESSCDQDEIKLNQDETKLNQDETNLKNLESSPQRGNGKGNGKGISEGESEGDGQGVTSPARYDSSYAEITPDSVMAQLPARFRVSKGRFRTSWLSALESGQKPEFLQSRLVAFYASPMGQGECVRHPHTFLDDEGYDESDETWAASQNGQAPTVKASDILRGKV